jgi:antitoxin component YwqK of YwqJK toxin-antitoxin module
MSINKSLPFLLMLFLVFASVSTALAVAKTFHPNGKLESETFYNLQSQAKEKALWYDQNGLLQAEEEFSSATSKVVTFYNDKGQKKTEETIVDGKRVRVRSFHPNGNVMIDYTLKDEKLDGKYLEYREDGKISKEIDYKDGKEI